MDYFTYKQDELYAENVAVKEIVKQFGSPCYIYSRATIERHFNAFANAFSNYPHLICYAVKANSNLAVLDVLNRLGAGFDIVSGGELERVLAIGAEPKRIVFSGVGKTHSEIKRALDVGIGCFNVESDNELYLIETIAKQQQCRAPISIRVNPDINANTHPYISTGLKENKFGIEIGQVLPLYQYAQQSEVLEPIGIDCHIGSQLLELEPFLDALERVVALANQLEKEGIDIRHLDLGGGLGVCYASEEPPHPDYYAEKLLRHLKQLTNKRYELIVEPGRAIAANAGILVTSVLAIKANEVKNFAIVDAAMNDLLRPALYEAFHDIIPVSKQASATEQKHYDIVGPVCETGDFLAKDRMLSLQAGDTLAIRTAGAYGFVMSSNYNTRPRVAELMVDGDEVHVVRERESIKELFAHEHVLPR